MIFNSLTPGVPLCSSGNKIAYTSHGRAYNFFDPSNSQTMNAALVSIIYSQLIAPPSVIEPFVSLCHFSEFSIDDCWTFRDPVLEPRRLTCRAF